MTSHRTLAAIILSFVLATSWGISALAGTPTVAASEAARVSASVRPEAPAPFGVHGGDADDERRILDAVQLFEDAGLALPELRIFVHETLDGCHGSLGRYSLGGDLHRIDLCDRSEFLVLHELAHVWERFNVDEATRIAFMESAGSQGWNDHTKAHPTRGVEQAADTIVWGLTGYEVRSDSTHHADEIAHFELLTGMTAPRVIPVESLTFEPRSEPLDLEPELVAF